MGFWEYFWDVLWFALGALFLIAYLMALFAIIGDLFRDRQLGGVAKALWLVFLIFLPLLTALAYLILRGGGMAERSARDVREAQAATDAYVRSVAGASPSDEIAKAKALLDAGTIDADEYAALKARALGSS